MATTILKYTLEIRDATKFMFTGLVHVLSVAEQKGNIVFYVLKDTECKHKWEVEFRIVATGGPMTFNTKEHTYLGVVPVADGELMWHVWYKEIRK